MWLCTVSHDSREGEPKLCVLSRPRNILLVPSRTLFGSSLIATFHHIWTKTNESYDGNLSTRNIRSGTRVSVLQFFYLQLSYVENKKSLKATKVIFTYCTSRERPRSLYTLMQVEISRDLMLWHGLATCVAKFT